MVLKQAAMMPLAAVAVVSLAGGCTSGECLDNRNSLPLAGCYASLPEPSAVSIDSVSIYGIGAPGDSVLLDSVKSLQQAHLPFRLGTGRTQYVIHYLQRGLPEAASRDTLTFTYTERPYFVSEACGAVYYFEDVKATATSHFIDSVTCPAGRITNRNIENIRIYFRIETGENPSE